MSGARMCRVSRSSDSVWVVMTTTAAPEWLTTALDMNPPPPRSR